MGEARLDRGVTPFPCTGEFDRRPIGAIPFVVGECSTDVATSVWDEAKEGGRLWTYACFPLLPRPVSRETGFGVDPLITPPRLHGVRRKLSTNYGLSFCFARVQWES